MIFLLRHIVFASTENYVEIYHKGIQMQLFPLFWTGGNAVLTSFNKITNLTTLVKNKADDHQEFSLNWKILGTRDSPIII